MNKERIAHIRDTYKNATESNIIERAANDFLGDVQDFPLQVVSLMRDLGFDVFRTNFRDPNQSGLIAVDSSLPEQNKAFTGDRAILLNREDSVEHQRFTIAHELAHYIFDFNEQENPVFYKAYYTSEDKAEQPEEVRAGRFAAALLMPEKEFRDKFESIKQDQGDLFSMPEAVTELKQYFGAPATSVRRRMKELKLQS